jgi:hypothetical protein
MKLITKEQISQVFPNAREILAHSQISIDKDEFTIAQPFDNGEVIILGVVEKNGLRTIETKITDNFFILPQKAGTLDVFIDVED